MTSPGVLHVLAVALILNPLRFLHSLNHLMEIIRFFFALICTVLSAVTAQAVGLDDGPAAVAGGALLVEVLVIGAHTYKKQWPELQ